MTSHHLVVPVREPFALPAEVAHAAQSRSLLTAAAREALRLSVIAADAHATADISLALLWRELARGRYGVVDGFFSEERCHLVLSTHAGSAAQPIDPRRLEILVAVLGGLLQKNVALDFDLAPSTIALNSRLALESMGVKSKPSRVHPLLMLAAKAASDSRPTLAKCSSFATREGRELLVVSAARPDLQLQALLPSAELAVIRRLVEGLSYVEIARARGTATRTIANQITAVFRRLHVSGRNELVQRLFSEEGLGLRARRTSGIAASKTGVAAPREADAEPRNERWAGARRSA